jgi:hypothetical protein
MEKRCGSRMGISVQEVGLLAGCGKYVLKLPGVKELA